MEKKKAIEEMYFEHKKSLTEIAEVLDVSVSYVTKILKQNEFYIIEKEKRKQENFKNRRAKQKETIYKQRRQRVSTNSDYLILRNMHDQASRELSQKGSLGSRALRKWNTSAYNYNSKKKRYEFDAGSALKPADFPKYIKI